MNLVAGNNSLLLLSLSIFYISLLEAGVLSIEHKCTGNIGHSTPLYKSATLIVLTIAQEARGKQVRSEKNLTEKKDTNEHDKRLSDDE